MRETEIVQNFKIVLFWKGDQIAAVVIKAPVGGKDERRWVWLV
jgi:hypothetical protein